MTRRYTNELVESIDLPLSYNNRLLLQFDFAGLNPYTTNFARFAFADYKPSTNGERLFNHCITNLDVFVAADENLQFGWNEQHLIRNQQLHLYEYEHILLASALAECLPANYAAAVLHSFASLFEDKLRVNPPLSSWKALVHSLNGLVTTSDFALMIEDRMRLDPNRVTSGHSLSCSNNFIEPQAFAQALRAISELSNAGSGQLSLVGGNFLGWFCAFAELFLGINVEVSSKIGEVLYTTKFDSNSLLRLIFVDDVKNLTPILQSQKSEFTALTLISEPHAKAEAMPRLPFTGRASWEALLPKVFESSFQRLAHHDSKMFVQSVGGVARLFQFIAEDQSMPEDMVTAENRANTASWGKGLIQTLCNFFPELRHLQGRLDRIQTNSREEAMEKADTGAKAFVDACGCSICSFTPRKDEEGNTWFVPDGEGKELPPDFCLLAIMETILNLGLSMSRITAVPRLYPSRAGILCLYQRQVRKLLRAKELTGVKYGRLKTLFVDDWNANYSKRLQTAVAIFSGSWPEEDLSDNLVAISHEGICAYVMGIQYGPSRKRDADVIRIQTGRISWKQKIYSRACLGAPIGIPQSDYGWEHGKCGHLSQELYFK